MDLETVDICSICLDAYDSNVRPRCLPCGHSFCTSCITNSIRDGRISCPYCQKPHRAYRAENFPISYSMEAVILELRKAKRGVETKAQKGVLRKIESSSSVSSGSKWQAVFREEKATLRQLIDDSKEVQSQMLDYEAFLGKRRAEHEELIPKIYEWVNRNEVIVREIAEEEKMLKDALKEGDEVRKKASDTLQRFNNVESIKDIITGSEEVERSRKSLSEWRKSSQNQLPCVKTIRCSEKILGETTIGLSLMNAEDKCLAELTDVDLATLPITRKVEIARGRTDISVQQLRDNAPDIKSRLDQELVYAVQNKEGRIRSAKIVQKNGKTYLYHLQDVSPPINAFIVKHSELLDCLQPDAVTTFMDLSWEGSIRGRLHILLSPNTDLARHFKILCSGEHGPSYANTNLLNLNYKLTNDEQIYGGDYERGDGTGGAPLFKGIDPTDKIYRRRSDEGIVWARYDEVDGARISQFAINTRNNSNSDYLRVFGQIQDGLEVLRAAINLDNITKVRIAECGIVISF